MARPEHDLVLLGATGFTGRLTAAHLASRAGAEGQRIALAGRDPERLARLATDLGGHLAVEVVDTGDLAGLSALAARTRVLATTVGPYARHGRLVPQACARAGTSYLDLAGEPAFVADVAWRHDAEARRTGATLVSSCGFESVVTDLGAQLAVEALAPGDDEAVEVRSYLRGQGAASGGTIASALESLSARSSRVPPPSRARRRTTGLPDGLHDAPATDGVGIPLPTVDGQVVRRSAARLPGYGASFAFGYFLGAPSRVAGLGMLGAMGALTALAAIPPTRALLRRVAPSAGEGPSAERRAEHWFRVTSVATAGGRQATSEVAGGDPGYGETAVILAEAALALAAGEGLATGACGPAEALGPPLRERLRAQGLRLEATG
ncbi:MAG: saccharopine dehydrogenase family protein [Actinomycetota bacterium]